MLRDCTAARQQCNSSPFGDCRRNNHGEAQRAELEDVLGRRKFAARLRAAQVTVDELVYGYAALATTIRTAKIQPAIKDDPDDDIVLACAIAAKAEVIASGDGHLLELKEYEGIRILTVNQVLEEV